MSLKIKHVSFYDWLKYISYLTFKCTLSDLHIWSNNLDATATLTQEHRLIINHICNMNMWSCLSGCSLKWWIGMNTACHGSPWHYSPVFSWAIICHWSTRVGDDGGQSNSPVSDIAVVFAPSLPHPSNSHDKIQIAGNVSREAIHRSLACEAWPSNDRLIWNADTTMVHRLWCLQGVAVGVPELWVPCRYIRLCNSVVKNCRRSWASITDNFLAFKTFLIALHTLW